MEISDVVFLVVAVAVMLIKFVASLGETKGENAGGEVFPQMEPLVPIIEEVKSCKRKRAAKPVSPAPSPAKDTLCDNERSGISAPAVPARKNRFAIKDKSDAKRAIIYAEIFNRKYN